MSRQRCTNTCPCKRVTLANNVLSHLGKPPSSAFRTFSPRKARGEKALDAKESLKTCEKCEVQGSAQSRHHESRAPLPLRLVKRAIGAFLQCLGRLTGGDRDDAARRAERP